MEIEIIRKLAKMQDHNNLIYSITVIFLMAIIMYLMWR